MKKCLVHHFMAKDRKTSDVHAKNVWYAMVFYNIFSNKIGPDEGSPIPVDVISHGDKFGLKGVN